MRALLLAIAVVLAAPGVAGAAAAPEEFGGGALAPGTGPERAGPGTAAMFARVFPNGRAIVDVHAEVGRCGLAFGGKAVRPAADGSFRFTSRVRFSDGRRVDRVKVAGRFEGTTATGTAVARTVLLRRDGSVRRRCEGRRYTWQLRRRPAPAAPAPPQPDATYHGLTSQRDRLQLHPFLLRVDETGTRVAASLFSYVRDCRRPTFYLHDLAPTVAIRPDGTFTQRQRFTAPGARRGERERFRVRVDGQFGAGVVTGTLRVRTVVRRSGRTVDRCDTGALTFGAAL